jgi:hypothetical protein
VKSWSYNKEIQTLVEQFAGAFNDIIIKRFDKDDNFSNQQKVKFVYAPKQRVLESLRTPAPGGLTVPAIAINIASLQRDGSRVFNKNNGFELEAKSLYGRDLDFVKFIRQPVPINIGINMSIITKYQTDMDQILSNFIPYCDSYIIISWKMPIGYNKDYEIRTEILWSGTVNLVYPTDLPPSQSFRITADTSFTIKGWLFKSTQYNETYKKIYYINSDFVVSNEDDINSCDLITDLDQYQTSRISISARPHVEWVSPLTITKNNIDFYYNNRAIYVVGKFLSYTRAVYISASNSGFMGQEPQLLSPFAGLTSLEPHYPSFYGYPISSFEILDDETLTISLPFSSINTGGSIDVIVENEAGYRSFIKESTEKYLTYSNEVSSSLYMPISLSGIRLVF